jgi:CRP/FNR family transcriptional regulator, cyclic AMP receptor protein
MPDKEIPNLARVNVNQLHDESLRLWQRIIDFLAREAGSTTFLLLNLAVFTLWLSTGGVGHDFYPFQFLTMAVSLEAIVLSSLILISQNRQSDKDRLAAEADYHTNLAAKEEIEAILRHIEAQDTLMIKQHDEQMDQQKLMYAFLKTMAAYPTKQRSR